MTTEAFAAKARRHWKEWLPQKTAQLKALGTFEEAVRYAAAEANKQKLTLMQAGFQEHEADEIVLKEWILLDPEPDRLDEEEDEEDEEREREYQELMQRLAEIDRKFDAEDEADQQAEMKERQKTEK
jgi:hypothetical protein